VHQAVDPAVQADEDAEIGDRLDDARTRSPLLKVEANSFQGFGMHCLMPSETRRRSSSISSTMTSISSPIWTTFDGLTFLLVQSISETCTRPSTPSSISTKAP
jgi:hypothetical protein